MSEVLLQQILSELKDVKTGQRDMQGQMDGMQSQMDGMQSQMGGMQGQLDRIENKQDAIFEQTGQLMEFRQEILVKFDHVTTKEDMHYIEAKLMEHDRDLFNLKKRA